MERTCSKAGLLFLNAAGECDMLPRSELAAVNRSGRSSWQRYIIEPTQWPPPTSAVVPLMEGRPGAVEPLHVQCPVDLSRNGVSWSYDELCALMKANPSCNKEITLFAKENGRSPMAVESQRSKLMELVYTRKLKWDGERLLRGSKANVSQWPMGFRNPK